MTEKIRKLILLFMLCLAGFWVVMHAEDLLWMIDPGDDYRHRLSDSSADARRFGVLYSEYIPEQTWFMYDGKKVEIQELWIEQVAIKSSRFSLTKSSTHHKRWWRFVFKLKGYDAVHNELAIYIQNSSNHCSLRELSYGREAFWAFDLEEVGDEKDIRDDYVVQIFLERNEKDHENSPLLTTIKCTKKK
jgi:hypothetical protein